MWIAIEGIDGAGKSSLINILNEKLRVLNIDHIITREPGSTELGKELRDIIENTPHQKFTELFLFAADRAEHYQSIVEPALKENKTVVSDRSVFSSIAYQGYGYGYNIDDIVTINKVACKNKFPDLLVYLKIAPEKALERIKKTRPTLTHFERLDFLKKVSEGFDILTQKYNTLIVDAEENSAKIAEQILEKLTS